MKHHSRSTAKFRGLGVILAVGVLGLVSVRGGKPANPDSSVPPIPPLSAHPATAIAVGWSNACALRSGGSVVCWTYPVEGRQRLPVQVSGITDATAIAVGVGYTCALRSGRGVMCWGLNTVGQLGNGTLTNSRIPVPVSVLTDAIAIAAGDLHACAIRTGGGVMCWGLNADGQLGNGTLSGHGSPIPAPVSGITDAKAIADGADHTCVVRSGGGVACWGNGSQLGNGTPSGYGTSPVPVAGVTDATTISAGRYHTCILRSGGAVKCWGLNQIQLATNRTTTFSPIPLPIPEIAGARGIAAGAHHSCALRSGGGVVCWGRNDAGQLGDGTVTDSPSPVPVSGITDATAIAAGGAWTCALTKGGTVKCWGWHSPMTSPLVNVPPSPSGPTAPVSVQNSVAVPIAAPATTKSLPSTAPTTGDGAILAAGNSHTCTVTIGGGVKCWGINGSGQLGNGSRSSSLNPVNVAGLTSGVRAIAAGDFHTCVITSRGGVKCWGINSHGALGNGSTMIDSLIPVDVVGLTSGVTAIAAGYDDTCALTAKGGVKCWGNNSAGQLGNGSRSSSTTPVDVAGLSSGVTAIAASDIHTCALTSGGVKCWGDNTYGRLGNRSTANRLTPVDVADLTSGVIAIAAGYADTCALTIRGGVKCWGSNTSGQLGDGTFDTSYTPVNVVGLASGVSAIAAGDDHTCALTARGGVKCWGLNLGNGSMSLSYKPVDVTGLTSGVKAIAAGKGHTCAFMSAGAVKCWGWNAFGQLGDGTTSDKSIPVNVTGL
jgi:alpha-tubulin suppressor-like RCC1 family protein